MGNFMGDSFGKDDQKTKLTWLNRARDPLSQKTGPKGRSQMQASLKFVNFLTKSGISAAAKLD
jgi:hypothetical protein